MACFGYVRVSTVEQALGLSLEEQERRIRAIGALRGEAIQRVFVDPGVTGSKALELRPAGRDLCGTLRPGDVLIVAKLDRAFRSAADALARAEQWRAAGIQLVVADMGVDPVTGNGVGKMFFGMLAVVAEFERERILERTQEGKRAKALRGGHVGGSAPLGFAVEGSGKAAHLVQDPKQQAALRTIRRLHSKMSLRMVAAEIHRLHGLSVSHECVRRVIRDAK